MFLPALRYARLVTVECTPHRVVEISEVYCWRAVSGWLETCIVALRGVYGLQYVCRALCHAVR